MIGWTLDRGEYTVVLQAGTEQLADPMSQARASKDKLREGLETGNSDFLFSPIRAQFCEEFKKEEEMEEVGD